MLRLQEPLPSLPPAPTEIEALAESLSIGAAELEFARTLSRLLPTPRGAERFANIYRLLKASLPRNHRTRFEGSEGVPGEFQLPMLLLALLVGQSKAAELLFPRFQANAQAGQQEWWAFGEPRAGRFDGLLARFGEIAAAPLFPSAPELVVAWLPQVAPYSFTTARMFLGETATSPSLPEHGPKARDPAPHGRERES